MFIIKVESEIDMGKGEDCRNQCEEKNEGTAVGKRIMWKESRTMSQTPSVTESGAILRFGGGRYLHEISWNQVCICPSE